jgi:hypothetical protein
MLYRPQWDQLSTEAFIGWLEKQPADGEYNFLNCFECAIGQYAQSIGKDYYDIPAPTREIWNRCAAAGTFGTALTRARALVTD